MANETNELTQRQELALAFPKGIAQRSTALTYELPTGFSYEQGARFVDVLRTAGITAGIYALTVRDGELTYWTRIHFRTKRDLDRATLVLVGWEAARV